MNIDNLDIEQLVIILQNKGADQTARMCIGWTTTVCSHTIKHDFSRQQSVTCKYMYIQ